MPDEQSARRRWTRGCIDVADWRARRSSPNREISQHGKREGMSLLYPLSEDDGKWTHFLGVLAGTSRPWMPSRGSQIMHRDARTSCGDHTQASILAKNLNCEHAQQDGSRRRLTARLSFSVMPTGRGEIKTERKCPNNVVQFFVRPTLNA